MTGPLPFDALQFTDYHSDSLSAGVARSDAFFFPVMSYQAEYVIDVLAGIVLVSSIVALPVWCAFKRRNVRRL